MLTLTVQHAHEDTYTYKSKLLKAVDIQKMSRDKMEIDKISETDTNALWRHTPWRQTDILRGDRHTPWRETHCKNTLSMETGTLCRDRQTHSMQKQPDIQSYAQTQTDRCRPKDRHSQKTAADRG